MNTTIKMGHSIRIGDHIWDGISQYRRVMEVGSRRGMYISVEFDSGRSRTLESAGEYEVIEPGQVPR